MENDTVRTRVMLARGDQTPMTRTLAGAGYAAVSGEAYHGKSHGSLQSCKYGERSRRRS